MDKGQKYILQYYSFSLYSKMIFSAGVKVWIGTPFSTLKSCPLCSGPRYFWFQVSSHSYIIVPLYVMWFFFWQSSGLFIFDFQCFYNECRCRIVWSYLSSGVHGISWSVNLTLTKFGAILAIVSSIFLPPCSFLELQLHVSCTFWYCSCGNYTLGHSCNTQLNQNLGSRGKRHLST